MERDDMPKNPLRRGAAILAIGSLVSLGLVVQPANAAAGDITISPTTGTTYSVFNTDSFGATATLNPFLSGADTSDLRWKIDNADQHTLLVEFNETTDNTDTLDILGIKADGSTITVEDIADVTAAGKTGTVVIDFAFHNIVSAVIFNFTSTMTKAKTPTFSVLFDETAGEFVAGGNPTDATADGYARLGYGKLGASISIQAWLESSSATLVDVSFASAVETITYVDPSSVSIISKVERLGNAVGQTVVNGIAEVDVLLATNIAIDAATTGTGEVLDGVTLVAGDRILLVGQTTSTQDGVYIVQADDGSSNNVTALASAVNGDVAAHTSSITTNTGTTNNGVRAISGTAGTAMALLASTNLFANNIYGMPNAAEQVGIGGSLRFSNSTINLDQVDLTKWEYSLTSSVSGDTVSTVAVDLLSNTEGFTIATANMQTLTPAGYSSTNKSLFGRLLFRGAVSGDTIAEAATYKFTFRHGADLTPFADFSSAAYEVSQNTVSATAVEIRATVQDTENVAVAAYSSGYPTKVRNGTAAATYSSIIQTAADAAVETPNVPVMAKVTAGANLPAGATLTVSGTTERISKANGALYVTGLTGSKGDWDVTVTSSDTSSAGSTYVVEFFVLKQGSPDAWAGTFDGSNVTKFLVDYAAATYTTFTADSSVLSGATATVTLLVKDQFGQGLSASSTAKAYSVELLAPVSANLKQYVAVVDGKATFTFDNYLTEGASDVLTAKLFTGTSTSPSYVSGASTNISLYNSNAASAVNVLAKVTSVVVTYDDFITGAATSTNVAPNDNKFTYTGSVVDANGAGVPGAPVVITGSGFQFAKTGTTTYSIDSITLAASEAGSFSVDVYTHVASLTQKLTVTSGTKTASSVIASAIPVDGNGTDGSTGLLSAANLKFSWDAPATPVMNTTYAVTATVTDKWGNPVKGAAVTFGGFAAALFNGVASTNKVTGSAGTAVAYLRSIKDVAGLAAIGVTLTDVDQDADAKSDTDDLSTVFTDVVGTVWDESTWSAAIDAELTFLESAADLPAAASKVNAGSFKGYVALYALGYEGQRLSAKVGNDWVIVPAIPAATNDLFRKVEFVGAGVEISVRIYIDRVLLATIPLLTK